MAERIKAETTGHEAEMMRASDASRDAGDCGCGIEDSVDVTITGRSKHRHPRSDEQNKALLTRLRRIEGQVRGLEKMVRNNEYCPDILIQVSAVKNALNSFNKQLLTCHINGCVVHDIRNGDDSTVEELCEVIKKLMK